MKRQTTLKELSKTLAIISKKDSGKIIGGNGEEESSELLITEDLI